MAIVISANHKTGWAMSKNEQKPTAIPPTARNLIKGDMTPCSSHCLIGGPKTLWL